MLNLRMCDQEVIMIYIAYAPLSFSRILSILHVCPNSLLQNLTYLGERIRHSISDQHQLVNYGFFRISTAMAICIILNLLVLLQCYKNFYVSVNISINSYYHYFSISKLGKGFFVVSSQ